MAQIVQPPHPFYPIEANIIGYLANDHSVAELVAAFAIGCLVILGGSLVFVRQCRIDLSGKDEATMLWFVLCGTIHFFFEGYFAYHHAHMPGRQDLFGQLWKEYSHSDSRYMTSDPFVLCMETITAVFWGPLSYLLAYLIATRHSLRHPIQSLVSLGQLYGDILYYATSMFDLYYKGLNYCRPEAYYFWFYYFAMNFLWIVIPSVLLYSSVRRSTHAFHMLEIQSRSIQHNGHIKKSL